MKKIFSTIISSPLKGRLCGLLFALLATTSLCAQRLHLGDLYYNITSDTTIEVTYESTFYFIPNYSSLTTISIPETISYDGTTYRVTSIGDSAFFTCSSLTSITIPNSITSIGSYVFYNCSSLTSVTIPNSVTSIGDGAFYGCSLTYPIYNANCFAYMPTSFKGTYTIPNGIKQIASYAFKGCRSLTSVTIPNSVTSIGYRAFTRCAVTFITCEASTPPALETEAFDNSLSAIYIPDNTLSAYQIAWGTNYSYVNNETILTIHVDVSGTLSDKIFDAGKRPIQIPKLIVTGMLNVDDFTCMRETMTSLVDVDLSNITNTSGVKFNDKSNLVKIILPSNLTSIEDEAFSNCSSLTSITIPNSVTSIGYEAFYFCDKLPSITIPNSVTSIGDEAFSICSSLTSITIPNSVTSIGNYAFYDCSSLTSVTIPNSVTSIGSYAFNACRSFTSVIIGNSVTSIGDGAFSNCTNLTSITCLATTPSNASNLGANTTTCTLTVPQSAYNAYLRHAYWGSFLNINAGYLVTLQTNNTQWGKVTGDGLYFLDSIATITATPNEGYSFLRWSDGNTDNPRTIQVTSDTTLTAEFAIEGGCLVTFVDWDGTVLYSVSVVPGDAATAPAELTREGYTFIGWDKDFTNITEGMTITALYQINRYRVRFFDFDDTLLHTDSVEYQATAVAPADPYRAGYTFTGWDKAFDSITADLDVYAQYEIGEDYDMTIVFTNSEDNDSEIYAQTLTIKIPAAPTIAGFTFLKWRIVEGDLTNVITIQAIYEADTPTATEVYINPANPTQKLLRNGQLYILKDGKTYTVMGAEIK